MRNNEVHASVWRALHRDTVEPLNLLGARRIAFAALRAASSLLRVACCAIDTTASGRAATQ
jgi:hypothetical protein